VTENTAPTGIDSAGSAGPGAPEPAPRRLRADAQRNIDSLLEAAKAVFATSGVDAPAKEIADLAGVGVGTLYRHFPQRSDLVKAVFQREVDACADAAPALAAAHEPGAALAKWLHRYTEFLATKRGLATALHSGDPAFDALPGYFMQRLGPALGSLLEAAAASGEIRADISPRTSCTPSPTCACPWRTREPRTASAWSRSSSTDCATAPTGRPGRA
jgi:AcrR family transcriptional regulator